MSSNNGSTNNGDTNNGSTNSGANADGANANEPTFLVVRNAEEQYSIWPAGREMPAGWDPDGTVGTKDACLAHIAEVWTDMRPLSLRRRMERSHA